ncbi:MAG: Fatty acid desaturase [Phycisphaerales bacterium]|nr:Fatty acid desaturase [Phycisphaerales bacterium]
MDVFAAELDALQLRLRRSVGPQDLRYIARAERFGRACTVVGYATAWILFNPVSVLLIAFGKVMRWGIAHHVLHRAFDGIEGAPPRFRSSRFGKGWRRFVDWNDWMIPAGFQHEHNVHHVYTGGGEDPDLVEANMEFVRQSPKPKWCKYLMVLAIAATWRLTYYAPGTFIQLRRRQKGLPPTRYEFTSLFFFRDLFLPLSREGWAFWARCVIPYALTHFVAAPALFYAFVGPSAAVTVLATLIAAEVLANLYTFVLIASSHTGSDIHRFDAHSKGRPEFYRHQFLGTVNYSRGPDLRDFVQLWINYQIEHHVFPNLPPSKYAECSRELEAICVRHGVPYRSEPLRRRCWRMLDVVVGDADMRRDADLRRDPNVRPNTAAAGDLVREMVTAGHVVARPAVG